MDFSEFCKKMYAPNTFKDINSQHQFVACLFRACKVDAYPERIIRGNPHYHIFRKMFDGTRKLAQNNKELIRQNLTEDYFVEYFKIRILHNSALIRLTRSFGLNQETNIDEVLLHICRELQNTVGDIDGSNTEELKDNAIGDESLDNTINTLDDPVIEVNSVDKEKKPVSLWIPDAENATDEQAEFRGFTNTISCKEFIEYKKNKANKQGILSVKGAGKTYILQMKRRIMDAHNMNVIPIQSNKLSKDNEWGIESVRINSENNLSRVSVNKIALLWKASIVCLAIVCVSRKEYLAGLKRSYLYNGLPESIKYIIDNPDEHQSLNSIMNRILTERRWAKNIGTDYTNLMSILKQIINAEGIKLPIVVFIDKTDQATIQPDAEVPDCEDCYKDFNYARCEVKDKELDDNKKCIDCVLGGCCKTCKVYRKSSKRSKSDNYGKRNEHITEWQHLQIGLIIAVSNLIPDFKNSLQVHYSIRQEALYAEDGLLSGNANKYMDHTKVLHYLKEEQREIFYNTIKIQPKEYLYNPKLLDNSKYEEALVGVDELCHPYVEGAKETIFDCVYRHTFDRAREIQRIGEKLSSEADILRSIEDSAKRAEKVKSIIETAAAELLFDNKENNSAIQNNYYGDKRILLNNYWANANNFCKFIGEIDRNLLFMDEMSVICRSINDIEDCCQTCSDAKCNHHPFSMLYRMGLLGIAFYNENVEVDCTQQFLDSHEITYFRDTEAIHPNEQTLFILHPALTKCIEKCICKTTIKHFKGFILGKGLSVPREIHKRLLEDRANMDRTSFENKYYS